PSFFSSFSKSALNAASASTIASKDFFTSAGKSSALMFCHFNSSRAMVLLQLGRTKRHTLILDQAMVCTGLAFGSTAPEKTARRASGAGPDRRKRGRKFKPMVPVAGAMSRHFRRTERRRSLRLNARQLHHLGPFLNVLGDELPELGGRTCKRRVAKVCNPRFHRGIGKNGIDLLVEFLDDIGRCIHWRADTQPRARIVAW